MAREPRTVVDQKRRDPLTGELEAVDFGRCLNFDGIIHTLVKLHEAKKVIPTDGEEMTAAAVAQQLDKALMAVRKAGLIKNRLRLDGKSLTATRLTAEEIIQVEKILADHRITRQGGLRKRVVDIINSGDIDCSDVYFNGLRQLSEKKINQGPTEFAETVRDVDDEQQRAWEKELEQRTWEDTVVAKPTIVNQDSYQLALASVLNDERRAQDKLRAARVGDNVRIAVRLGKPYSLAHRVETMLTPLGGIAEVKRGSAENTLVTDGKERTVIARTLLVPREDRENVQLTILSEEAQEPGPLGDAIEDTTRLIGIVVEHGDEAWLKKAEQVLRKQLGLEFRLTKKS